MGLDSSSKSLDFVASSLVRRKLLEHLTKGPLTPTELASMEQKHVSHVSRALAELKAQGLVESMSSHSRERYYRATYQGLATYYMLLKVNK